MSKRLLINVFENEQDILGATKAVRENGYKIVDVFTPYAVHGLDAAQGLKKSKLPFVCFALGLTGAVAKLGFQIWTSATSWALNVGGKPFKSVPAFVPVTFEIMVLFAGVGTVLTFFMITKLRPGKKPKLQLSGVTDNRFVLVLEQTDAAFEIRKLRELFQPYHLVEMEERLESSIVKHEGGCLITRVMSNTVLFVMLICVVVMIWFLRRDYTNRNQEFLPGMVESVPYDAQAENQNFTDGKTLQPPSEGTVAQNYFPLHYKATPEDAKRAGEELVNPIVDTLEKEIERGTTVFANMCSPCHGAGGLGDGNVIKKGYPPPPSLLAEKAMNMKDGQMFHILTYGQNNMPSLTGQVQRMDRWRVVSYVRSLQKKALLQMTTSSLTGKGEAVKREN